ncbi:ABC transporter permease [Clostridium senegalense]|uniref:ABC transporter permease n=1 Tax=Clostridium senegalense TaxID=1465809 RepID=UPI001C114EEE|nr:ABC transporter permease [Clostridium senegalense]MBU5227311.1 ABC transporter permease [Clostridium senegalense]
MNFLFRAFLNLKEKKVKSLILFIITLTVCVVVLSGIAIQSAAKVSQKLARESLGATVSLKVDSENMRNKMSNESSNEDKKVRMKSTPINISDVEQLAQLQHVKSYNLISTTYVNANSFEPIVSEESENENTNNETNNNDIKFNEGHSQGKGMSFGDINLQGVSDASLVEEYENNEITLVDGRMITTTDIDTKVAMIEETLASENNLKVGDKITVSKSNDSTITNELEIIGVFKSNEEVTTEGFMSPSMSPYNKIYVPYTFVNIFKGEEYTGKADKAEFQIDDPLNVESFVNEGNQLDIDFETYTLDANSKTYDKMVSSIESVASFARITLCIGVISGAVILTLIIMLSIKERIMEIGILMSLGEKKFKIISQFISEILIILVLAIGISGIVGNKISNVMAKNLLSNQIETSSSTNKSITGMDSEMRDKAGMMREESSVKTIDSMDIKITIIDFGKMSVVTILIAIVSILLPSISIMRLNPKNILSKHQ